MPQAVNPELLLHAGDTCLICMGKDTKTFEEQLNRDFNSLCEWFIGNKLSIHFGAEKTKSILFGTKGNVKNQTDLNIKYSEYTSEVFAHLTADTICMPQCLCFMYPFRNYTVPAKKLYPTLDQEHGI